MLAIKILLILIEIICGLLLIGVILMQKAKGEGLGMAFGGEMGESIFGARASNVLVKITIWLGVIFLLNTVILATVYSNRSHRSLIGEGARPPIEQPASPRGGPAMPQAAVPQAPATLPAAPSTPMPLTPAPAETVPQAPMAP